MVATVTSINITTIFADNWVILYRISTYGSANRGMQFVFKCFAAFAVNLGIMDLTATAYHPQTTSQVERFNRIMRNDSDTMLSKL